MNDAQRKAMFAKKNSKAISSKHLTLPEIDTNKMTTPKIYDALDVFDRQRILHDTGIPKDNFEPYTIDDIRKNAKLNYSQLDTKLANKVSNRIGEVSFNNLRNHAWVH